MCGIVARFFSGFPSQADRNALIYACSLLSHRGPDEQKVLFEKDAWMGATRLAIRDIEEGSQPLQRGGCTIIFNGELYNTKTLRAHLAHLGHSFSTQCDTEVLLCCYLEYGENCYQHLEGMFAFAIWDSQQKRVVIARDRWGQKPLFYTFINGALVIASEPRALQAWPDIPFDVKNEKIHEFLKNSYITGEDSVWAQIKKLKPGTLLFYQENGTVERYEDKTKSPIKQNGFFYPLSKSQTLFSYLQESVKNCLHSDRPIGAFLSGGIDSSTICYFLNQFSSEAPVFSVYWNEEGYSEEKYIQCVSNHLKLNHHSVYCTLEYFTHNFDLISQIFDEPFADESMIPTYCLCEYAKEHVDVVLSGDGADEFFLGYPRYFFKGHQSEYFEVFSATLKDTFNLICPDQPTDFLPYTFHSQGAKQMEPERIRSYYDIHHYLPDDILVKTDRCSMAHGLELRSPFLDSHICNLALSCSYKDLLFAKEEGKKILKESMRSLLPSLITHRSKQGFGAPLSTWFNGPLKSWLQERLLGGSLKELNFLSIPGIKKLIEFQFQGKIDYSRTLFNLLVLESWLRRKQIAKKTSFYLEQFY